MRLLKTIASCFCIAFTLASLSATAQTFKFQSVGFVTPAAINSSGTIAGSFCCSYVSGFDGAQPVGHGFSLQLSTQAFAIAEPPASGGGFATGIAPNGDVVGGFCPPIFSCAVADAVHGYLFSAISKSAAQIDVPGAIATLAGGINKSEQIVGMSCDTETCSLGYPSESHGFQLDHPGGTFITIDFPGAAGTAAAAINDAGEIVGNYLACEGQPCIRVQDHGFRLIGGTFTRLDPPGSLGTTASAVNNIGEIAGTYFDATTTHGFLLSSGTFTIVDYPGASLTEVTGINDEGQIVGWARVGSAVVNFVGTPQ
jgi:uncharacterized membrane protein